MSWYVHSISLGVTCGRVLTPLLTAIGLHVVCGIYFQGGGPLLVFQINTRLGTPLVVGFGVFQYWEDQCLECIDVNGTILPDIASDQPFDGFDSHLSSAIAVWKCYRAQAVVYSPLA